MKGFRFKAQLSIISIRVLKGVLMELSKNEEYRDNIMQAIIFAPLASDRILAFNGQLHFEFDDFEELLEATLKHLPEDGKAMAEVGMKTFN